MIGDVNVINIVVLDVDGEDGDNCVVIIVCGTNVVVDHVG